MTRNDRRTRNVSEWGGASPRHATTLRLALRRDAGPYCGPAPRYRAMLWPGIRPARVVWSGPGRVAWHAPEFLRVTLRRRRPYTRIVRPYHGPTTPSARCPARPYYGVPGPGVVRRWCLSRPGPAGSCKRRRPSVARCSVRGVAGASAIVWPEYGRDMLGHSATWARPYIVWFGTMRCRSGCCCCARSLKQRALSPRVHSESAYACSVHSECTLEYARSARSAAGAGRALRAGPAPCRPHPPQSVRSAHTPGA
jgi:hypothetical protein